MCWESIRGLFFFNKGVVDVTAALPGDFATGNRKDGGRFTRNLIGVLESGHAVDWMSVNSDVEHKTLLQTGAKQRGGLTEIPSDGPLGKPNAGVGLEMSFALNQTTVIPHGLGVELWSTADLPLRDAFTNRPIRYPGQLAVRNVQDDSPAQKAGLGLQDCILKVDGKPVRTACDFFAAIPAGKSRVTVEYARAADLNQVRWETRSTALEIPPGVDR